MLGRIFMSLSLVPVVALLSDAPALAEARSATCTETGVTWKVDFDYRMTIYGGLLRVTGLKKRTGGTESDASTLTWELRRDNWPNEWPPEKHPLTVKPFGPYPAAPATWPVRGGLSVVGAEEHHELTSPRLVTPDGECQVYLSPFANIGVPATAPKVGVLGDSLMQSLNDSDFNDNHLQGRPQAELNRAGILAEVEGQGGRRWTPKKNPTSALDKADSYQLDEYRGLLEHNVSGFVVGLGANDAFAVAFGLETQTEVNDKMVTVGTEMVRRTSCLVVLTAPERYRLSDGTFPTGYRNAAIAVNNIWRWIAAGEQTVEIIDFAQLSEAHQYGTPSSWFIEDNLHLNEAGKKAYARYIGEGARRCTDNVVLYGKDGTFGGGPLSGKTSLPTGQALRTQAVQGWEFEGGKSAYWSTSTADGTIMIGNMSQVGPLTATGNSMVISAFHPDEGTFRNIRVKTDRGQETMSAPDGTPVGFDIGGISTINNRSAVVFTGGSPYKGQDLDVGMFPVFGVLSKGTAGWQVAEGPGWRNAWSPREIVEQATNPALADKMCPFKKDFWGAPVLDPKGRQVRDCFGVTEVAVLPQSRDVVIAQYFGPSRSGQVVVLSLDGPNAAGRYTLQVSAVYTLPDVVDPNDSTKKLTVAPREVEADPTSVLGDERFGLASDVYGANSGVIEFSYNANETDPAKRVRPVSGPIMTGEIRTDGRLAVTSPFHYDHQGNLWTQAHDGFNSKGAIVYAKTAAGRKVSRAECGFDPAKPLETYILSKGTAPRAWGVECRPDYEIMQADAIGAIWNFDEDPVTHDIVAPVWPGGLVYVIDPEGSGENMTFRVSNVVNPLAQSVQRETRPCPTPEEPNKTCSRRYEALLVVVDGSRRAWVPVSQFRPGWPEWTSMDKLDQWIISIDLTKLQGRETRQLPARPGQATVLHAELKQTMSTVKREPGVRSDVDIDADAPVAKCGGCTDPVSGLSGGFMLADETGAGMPAGGFAEYRVVAPKALTYQVFYQARKVSGTPNIQLRVNGQIVQSTPVPNTSMGQIGGFTITLPPGTHTLRVESASGGQGWQLDWLKLACVA